MIVTWTWVDKFNCTHGHGRLLLKYGWTNLVTLVDRGDYSLEKGRQIWSHFWTRAIATSTWVDKFGHTPRQGQLLLGQRWTNSIHP